MSSNAMPLSSTVPFPDPIAPGFRTSTVAGGRPREYVGYAVPPSAKCGRYDIETATEYGGGICHKCDP
jgi:hypothetical protein